MRSPELSTRERELLEEHRLTPRLLLLGCTPFTRVVAVYRRPSPPSSADARSHVVGESHDRRPEFAGYRDEAPCPCCGDRVVDRSTIVICLRCSRMDERHEPTFAKLRTSAAIARQGRESSLAVDRSLDRAAASVRRRPAQLSEQERRRIWAGNRYTELAAKLPATNLAATGRAFLERIGQLPDFDRILDARGRTVGHWSALEREAAELLARESRLNVPPDPDEEPAS